jgi:hypothetical protein
MIRKMQLIGAIATFAFALICGHTYAATFTVMADIAANSPGNPTPLEGVTRLVTDGRTYVNTYFNGSGGGPGGGPPTPPSNSEVGDRIRSVFAVSIDAARNGVNNTPVNGPGAEPTSLILIGAFNGTTVGFDAGGQAIIAFDVGRAGLVAVAPSTFLSNDPDTWGIGGSVAAATRAEWSMEITGDGVTPDNGFNVFIPPGTLNTASIDPVNPTQTAGRFKFVEDSAVNDNPGDGFVTPTPSAALAAFIAAFGGTQALVATSDLDIEVPLNLTTEGLIGATDLAVLNAIAAWAGLGDLGGAGTAFATAIDTTPDGAYGDVEWEIAPNTINSTGDFRSQGGIDVFPAVQIAAIPEPSTICIWGVGLLGLAVCRRFRGRKDQN